MPRRGGGPPAKRKIANVKKVVAVASGKGGVGKSTVAVNLAFALAMLPNPNAVDSPRRLKVGVLDLDIFGPSIPTLMGLTKAGEPDLTPAGGLIPVTNHSLPCMSMGFLIPSTSTSSHDGEASNTDTPIVWRGLMVQKAVQQLLFDVDWAASSHGSFNASGAGTGKGLDVLVVDMPPGTGDVPLTLGQLVQVDGCVIVSTPQDVALSDVRKGIAMLRKVDVPITGLVLNQSYYLCPTCVDPQPQYIFGPPTSMARVSSHLNLPVLAELPLTPGVPQSSDRGVPAVLQAVADMDGGAGKAKRVYSEGMKALAEKVAGPIGIWTTL